MFMYSPQPSKWRPALSFKWHVKCEHCDGWGFYTRDGYDEVYCEAKCEAAKWRRIYDGGHPDEDP